MWWVRKSQHRESPFHIYETARAFARRGEFHRSHDRPKSAKGQESKLKSVCRSEKQAKPAYVFGAEVCLVSEVLRDEEDGCEKQGEEQGEEQRRDLNEIEETFLLPYL
jgi:hypothetical protein